MNQLEDIFFVREGVLGSELFDGPNWRKLSIRPERGWLYVIELSGSTLPDELSDRYSLEELIFRIVDVALIASSGKLMLHLEPETADTRAVLQDLILMTVGEEEEIEVMPEWMDRLVDVEEPDEEEPDEEEPEDLDDVDEGTFLVEPDSETVEVGGEPESLPPLNPDARQLMESGMQFVNESGPMPVADPRIQISYRADEGGAPPPQPVGGGGGSMTPKAQAAKEAMGLHYGSGAPTTIPDKKSSASRKPTRKRKRQRRK